MRGRAAYGVPVHDVHSQDRHLVRLEWGPVGARELTAHATSRGPVYAVVVDVLSFTTCVSVGIDRGMRVHPFAWEDRSAEAFAAERGALLAKPRRDAGPGDVSLSPASIRSVAPGGRTGGIVLPSPNGSAISALLRDAGATVLTASLRNARAVGNWLSGRLGDRAAVIIIAAGEKWPDGTLRPAVEDLWGAGAVVDALAGWLGDRPGTLSPEAALAQQAYQLVVGRLDLELAACSSGRELLAAGYAIDLAIAAELHDSEAVPLLRDGAFVQAR